MLSDIEKVTTFKWGSPTMFLPNKGYCAVLNGSEGEIWWQPEHCSQKHQFYCIQKGML